MSRAAALLAALLLALAGPGLAQEQQPAIAVVLDRSASLRLSDPERRGPRLLATALALVGDGQPCLLVGEAGAAPTPLPADAAALAAALAAIADAAPGDGGADLAPLLARAREAAGPSGVVLLLTDDDLDVFAADGAPPDAVLERARKGSPRPARDEVNRAAVELLVEAGTGLPRVVALRAPLPPLARTAPFLAAIGAQTVELEGTDAEVVAGLAEAITGAPRVLRKAPASAPAAGRAVLLLDAAGDVPGGAPLGGDRRAWLVDLSARQPLAGEGEAGKTWLVAPRLDPPGEAVAWSLRGGVVRVLARPGASTLVVSDGRGGPPVPLVGDGPWRMADLRGDPSEVEVAASLDDGAGGAVLGERRRVPVGQGEVVLQASGLVRAGEPLELRGRLPRGLPAAPVAIAVREAQGGQTLLSLAPTGPAGADGRVPVAVTFVPQTQGELTVEPRGDLFVRLDAPVSLTAAIRRRLTLQGFSVGGDEVPPGGVVELDEQGGATISLRLALDPPATAPVPLAVSLEGAPPGAQLVATATPEVAGVASGGLTIVDAATPTLRLTWPAGGGSARCAVRVRGRAGVSLLAGRSISVGAPASWVRRLAALGLLAGAAAWAILLLRKRQQTAVLIARTHGHRQLRAVGPNGRITFERYRFQEHASGDDLRVHIQPEDSQASIEICLRDDGTILAVGKDGARIVHEDRPTVLSDEAVLRHGTAFAVVHNKRARRYVYLEHEPSAEDLAGRFGDSMSAAGVSGAGSAMGESGLYVLLEDDQNLAASQDVSATGRIFPTSRRMVGMPESGRAPRPVSFESAPDADEASAHPVPTPSTAGPVEIIEDSKEEAVDPQLLEESDDALFDSSGETQVSDEGIVVMDSTEAEILDSQEIDRLEDPDEETSIGKREEKKKKKEEE